MVVVVVVVVLLVLVLVLVVMMVKVMRRIWQLPTMRKHGDKLDEQGVTLGVVIVIASWG